MRFFYLTFSALVAVASAASRANPFNIPVTGYTFEAGKPTTLTWDPTTTGPVSLRLQWGAVTTSDSGSLIAGSIPNSGSFTWTPPANLAAQPDYTIEIISDSDPSDSNYLPRFTVQGATSVATHSTAKSTSTAEKTTSASAVTTSSETQTTMMTTTATSSDASSTSASTKSRDSTTTTDAATTTSDASATASSSAAASETTVPNTNAGMANRVSGGLLAVMLGAVAVL
ncbi:hypothetical protein FE257_007737 [Aspergillus nanangensis]|uniref:Yeast cell wall synthesis Kre9/Knh1-like N-terminal domain-containing protein n=1 Tax=Aspergillus nanangensis TaxID=2582783 RepID=A0AAD4GYZ8_ASPNN|nr:hypothetical protein FE257_007737 [Aspergillus nanangensis]